MPKWHSCSDGTVTASAPITWSLRDPELRGILERFSPSWPSYGYSFLDFKKRLDRRVCRWKARVLCCMCGVGGTHEWWVSTGSRSVNIRFKERVCSRSAEPRRTRSEPCIHTSYVACHGGNLFHRVSVTYSDFIWAPLRLKSDVTWLFVLHLLQAETNKNSELCVADPLWCESVRTGDSPLKRTVVRKAFPRHGFIMEGVCDLCTDQRKHQSSASLAFVRGIHREPFDDVIMFMNWGAVSISGPWIR